MDILLHICCGPCLIYPFGRLKDQGFKVSGFYYNPNIFPVTEFYRRMDGLKTLSQELSISVEYPEYQEAEFSQVIGTLGFKFKRCESCWSLRLYKTAHYAKANGFRSFSTTLLVSPYQNHELLKQIGYQVAQAVGVDFYYEDFRVGFKQAQVEAKLRGIYRQKYCGCQYSMRPSSVKQLSASRK